MTQSLLLKDRPAYFPAGMRYVYDGTWYMYPGVAVGVVGEGASPRESNDKSPHSCTSVGTCPPPSHC